MHEILRAEREALSPTLEMLSETEKAAFVKLAEEIFKAGTSG